MTSIPASPIAALRRLTSVGIAGFASASLLAACAGSPLPTLASGDGGLMAGPDAAETRAEPTAKGSIEHWGKAYAKNPRSAEAALNYARRLRASGDKQPLSLSCSRPRLSMLATTASSPSTVVLLLSSRRSS